YSAICPGPGNPARSGSTPDATPVVNTVLISRVPVYFTFAPVCCSHGATMLKNAFCSSPPQVPITVTVLPLRLFSSPPELPPLEQPAAASRTTVNGANLRNHEFTGAPLQLVVGQTSPRPARAPWQLTVRDNSSPALSAFNPLPVMCASTDLGHGPPRHGPDLHG